MRKLKLYIATSLNGKIARLDGDLEWLESIPLPENEDYGYAEFYNSVDTTIQGYNTYKLIFLDRGFDNPYIETTNYVFTRRQDVVEKEGFTIITKNHLDFTRKLKQQQGKDIWLIGGGQLNTSMLNEGLIDEAIIHVIPIVLPDGLDIFGGKPIEKILKLMSSKAYSNGVVELKYEI